MNKKKGNTRTLIFEEKGLKMLAERLKEVRKTKGFTQEELSHESGLTLSQIARIETVKINPTVSTIFRIAKALDIKVSELFDFQL